MDTEPLQRVFQTTLRPAAGVRRIFLILILVCFLFFCFLNNMMGNFSKIYSEVLDPYNHSGLILDTPGCKIPKLDPFDESVKHLIQLKDPYVCDGDPVFLIPQPNATIVLNTTVLNLSYNITPENVNCSYNAIYREQEPSGYVGENTISLGDTKELRFGVPLGEEFLKVHCRLGKRNFTQYVPLVPIQPKIERTKHGNNRPDALNVILIGIDSVSKLNFLRHFRRTHNFLIQNLSAFDMKGYTKVGDNTFPNLVPMLTGHFIEHYWNESVRNEMFFDNLDFIWKTYSEKGYRTFYAEDSPYTGTFNYLKRGFKNPPTDYYFRALGLAITDSDLKKRGSNYCLNSQLETEIIYGYLKDFLKTMKHKLTFSFTMVSTLTHDYLNEAGYADQPTFKLLEDLFLEGVLNKSFVVVFSDHGIRFGDIRETYVGKLEERMPFMYVVLPKWFLSKNENIAKNLMENQNRLITLFDVHATLYHLLDTSKATLEEESSTLSANGVSLISEISKYRTCEVANILPHWCPCQVYLLVDPKDKVVNKAATAIIDEINKKLDSFEDRCAHLEIDEIIDARLGQVNDMVLRFREHKHDVINKYVMYGDKIRSLSDFLVTLRARPGKGVFEGTVRYNTKDGKMQVLGISRINKYGEQSWCINKQSLKKYCYCK